MGDLGTLVVVGPIVVWLRLNASTPLGTRWLHTAFLVLPPVSVPWLSIIAAHLVPATPEMLDGTTVKYVEEFKGLGLHLDLGAVLLIEVDGREVEVEEEASQVAGNCPRLGVDEAKVASSEEEAVALREAQKAASPALARVRPTTILEDLTVPPS